MPSLVPKAVLQKRLAGFFLLAVCLAAQLFVANPALAVDAPSNSSAAPSVLPGQPLEITLDGQSCALRFLAFRDSKGSIMLSLSDCHQLFGLDVQLNDKQELVLQGHDHSLILPPGSYLKYDSWPTLSGPAGKTVHLDIMYLPLETVAKEWKYNLNAAAGTNTIELQSPKSPGEQSITPPTGDLLPAGLPAYGNFASVPAMNNLWPNEKIVGGYYTTITNSSANRINNITLSCSSINGRVLTPGQVFSFNGVVGQRTTQRGYKVAPVYSGNKVVTGVGGGICQTSTTLYNAACDSGMQVLERHHHTLPVHYIASGRDATVSWGTADFKFRNNKDYPVKILALIYKNYVILAIARAD